MLSYKVVYWLLVALFMTLTVVGIVASWQNYCLLSLVVITFLMLLGKHLGYVLGRIKLLCSLCRVKIVKFYHAIVVVLADRLRKIVYRWENSEIASSPLLLLSPELDTEAHKEYVGRLKAAIDNLDVHNVALMGAYGSGKSSILKTFKACYPRYKYVDVSLASFSKFKTANSDDDNKGDGGDKLEYCILQQLFYHVRLSDIPESRFERIERIGVLSRIGITSLILLLAISSICLIQPQWLTDNFLKAKELLAQIYVKDISLCILLLGFAIIVFYLVRFFKRLGVKNFGINMSAATLEIEDRKTASVMNRYLDEIIYLFQKKRYEVVFFEDLDRFGTIDIFTKLRELNIILNQSEDIKRRIVFVYAMCDNVFVSPEDRTKFFDYIIPVIPYANVSNSADLFKRKFKALGLTEERLSTDFLTDISHFVTDTRVLKNIINEFTLYHNVLDSKLNLQHLLAIILYKNLYSDDFSLLHQGRGMLYEVFASVPKLKDIKRAGILKRMMEVDSEIKSIHDEVFNNILELKSVVVANFLKLARDTDRYPTDENGNIVNVERMYDDYIISMILQGNMGFKDSYSRRSRYVRKDEIVATLGRKFDYDKRKKLIENKSNGEIDKLRNERKSLETDLAYIDEIQLQKLVKNTQEVFSCVDRYNTLSEEDKKKYNVLGYLLKEGYIDEDYFYYISIFQEGRMTPLDNEFLLSVKFDKPKRYDYHLVEVETILANLNRKDFDKPAIINFDLLQFMLEHEKRYHDKCEALVETLGLERDLDLVYAYINKWANVPKFINKLANCYVNIWNDICKDSVLSRQDKMDLLKLLFAHAEQDAIRDINERSPFSEFLNQGDDWLEAFESCDENRALKVLGVIILKIANLKEGESDLAKLLVAHICESGMYELNLHNLKFVAVRNGLDLKGPDTSVYSVIMNSNKEKFKKQILANIDNFAECVAKEKDDSFVAGADVIELLKNKNVSTRTKIDLINNKQFTVNDSSDIDEDLLGCLLETDKMQANINNVRDYYEVHNHEFKDELIDFMNQHVEELCDDIKGKTKIEEGEKDFLPAIIKESRLDKQLSYAILDNASLWEAWNGHIQDLDEGQLFYALKKKILPLDYMNAQAANNFLSYFVEDDSKFDYGLFAKALEISDSKALKAFANAKCIERGLLHFNEISGSLTAMGEPFDRLRQVGEYVKVPVFNGMRELLDVLHSVRYLGKVQQNDDEFTVRVRKTR